MAIVTKMIYAQEHSPMLYSNIIVHIDSSRGCHAPVNCGEICDHVVKILTENFYCSIASMKLLQVLSLNFA